MGECEYQNTNNEKFSLYKRSKFICTNFLCSTRKKTK